MNSQAGEEVLVPLLVASDHLDQPIIGYNVIEELVKYPIDGDIPRDQSNIISSMTASFPDIESKDIKALVEPIKSNEHSELCLVKTVKHDVLIPKGNTVSVTCRANTRSNTTSKLLVLFEPLTNISSGASSRLVIQVRNSTDHDILLPNRTVLGRFQSVKSVTPVEVKEKCNNEVQENGVLITDKLERGIPKTADDWIPEVYLNGLTKKEKLVAQQMLLEESDCFSRDDEDIGCSEELKMKVNLTDNTGTPVQKNYNSIPKPLYPEVKQYIEDLLNRKFKPKSKSAYSSVVLY